MATSVSQSDLKQLLGIPDGADDFTVAVSAATTLIDEELSSSGLTASRLNLIALFLAAHFVQAGFFNGGLMRKKTGQSEEYYQMQKLGQGLDATIFGQQVKAFDSTGTLANSTTTQVKARFSVVQPTIS